MADSPTRLRRSWLRATGLTAAVLVAGGVSIGVANATQPGVTGDYVEDGHMVTICHRTGSATNPYVIITVDVAAIDGQGASDHDSHNQVGNGPELGDVIPPVPGYNEDGKNWFNNWFPGDTVTPDLCIGGSSPSSS